MIPFLTPIIEQLLPISFRILGVLAFLPLTNNNLKKMIWSVALATLFLGQITINAPLTIIDLIFEFFIGIIIGLPTAIFLQSASIWGELFDTSRGLNIGQIYDPHFQGVQAIFAKSAYHFIWVILLAAGILELNIQAVSDSLALLPVGTVSAHMSAEIVLNLGARLLRQLTAILAGSFVAILPIVSLFLFCDLAVGFLGKLLPQIQAAPVSFQIKSFLGIIVILVLLNGGFNLLHINVASPLYWYSELSVGF